MLYHPRNKESQQNPQVEKTGNLKGSLTIQPSATVGQKNKRRRKSNYRPGQVKKEYQAQQDVLFGKEESRPLPTDAEDENINGSNIFGTGLTNDSGEFNCFLNVIIQSLWHIRRFREEFMSILALVHEHIGEPCVTCQLGIIFSALSVASLDERREAVATISLIHAVDDVYPCLKEAEVNDPSEVLGVVLLCLHLSLESVHHTINDCLSDHLASNAYLAHTLFGLYIAEGMKCNKCGRRSRQKKYNSFYHEIDGNEMRTMKIRHVNSSFDEFLKLLEMNYQSTCEPEVGCCGQCNRIWRYLLTRPHVFVTALSWKSFCESVDAISPTLSSLRSEIYIPFLYRRSLHRMRYRLISMEIGLWDDVVSACEEGLLQPHILFFEVVE